MGKMMEEYFETRVPLKAVVMIIDIRHEATQDDKQMAEYVSYLGIPLIVIATKLDKITKSRRAQAIKRAESTFSKYEDVTVIPFSAETGENKQLAWSAIESYLINSQ